MANEITSIKIGNTTYNIDFSQHSHNYLPLSGGTITGNLTMMASNAHNTDQYIFFKYSNTDLDSYSWRIGYKGTGTGNDNRLIIQSNGSGAWTDVLTFGLTDHIAYFSKTPKVGTTNVSLEGHKHTKSQITDFAHTHDYLPLSGGTLTGPLKINNTTNASEQSIIFQTGADNAYNTYDFKIGKFIDSDNVPGFGFAMNLSDGTYKKFLKITSGGQYDVQSVDILTALKVSGYTYSKGFVKDGSSSSYVLTGDGGHKAISDFATAGHTHKFTWGDNNDDTNLEAILGNLQNQITANANAIQNKSDIHDHPYLPTAGGTMTGNISFDANRMIRWHQSDSYSISCPNTSNVAYMLINGFAGTTISKRLSVYKTATSAPNTSYHLYTDGSLYAASATIAGATKITNGADFTLQASSSTATDPGDLVFVNSSGTELGRIWLDQGTNFKLRYGGSDAAKMIIHENNIGTYAALKNHTHSQYATVEQLDESELATAEALNDLDTRVDALESNPGGTYVTDDDQEWSGVKTFLDGIRIGDDANPGSLESNRTIYFGDGTNAYITEVPSDQLSLKGNRINLNASNTLTSKAIFPETTNYKPISLPSNYTISNTRYVSQISFSRHCTFDTFDAVEEVSYPLYITGSSEYTAFSVNPGYTIEIKVGTGYTAYRDTLWIDSGYECPICGQLIEYAVQPYLDDYAGLCHRIRYYLTESSSSTTPISGTEKDITVYVDGYTSYNKLTISGSSTYAPGAVTIKYTNTGTSSKTVYLKGKLLRKASDEITILSAEAGYWHYTTEDGSDMYPDNFDTYPACGNCGNGFNADMRLRLWRGIGLGKTFYTCFSNIITYFKQTTYKANTTFSLPSLDISAYGPVTVLGNGIVSGTSTTFDNANLSYSDKGLINTTSQLCYKFADALSGFLVDSNQLSYISGAKTDVSNCPNRIFDITINNGLTFAQGNSSSSISPEYMFNTKDGKITLGYYPGSSKYSVELNYSGLKTPGRSGAFTLGSSTDKLGTIYSTAQINTSDERFKNWISDIDVDFEKLKKIPKKLFTWRDSFLKDDDDIHIGTSAQVIRDIYPEIVHVYNSDVDFCPPRDIYDPDAVLAIEYDKLGVIALAAVDKLHEENVQLKEENEQLKTRLDKLEAILKEKGIL